LKLLLDTHIWLWSLLDPRKLGRRARAAVTGRQNELWVSPIGAWELLVLAEAAGWTRRRAAQMDH
jgi:PIN domain nuclease of toxin-antitoxin system